MRFDYSHLANRIQGYGWEKLANNTNISVDYLVNNVIYGTEFTLSEANAISNVLQITESKVLKMLFFTPLVEKKQQRTV